MTSLANASVIHPREREKDLLYHLLRDLAQAPDVKTIAAHLFTHARRLFGAEYGFLALVSRQGVELRGVAGYGIDLEIFTGESISVYSDKDPVSLAYHRQKPVVVSPPPATESWLKRLYTRYPVRALWCFPLIHDKRVIGVLVLGYTTPRPAVDEDIRLLQAFSNEAALVVERVQMTEALRASEAWYRDLVETALDAMACVDLQGFFTNVNRGTEMALGWSREEMIGRHYRDFLSEVSIAAVQERERRIALRQKVSPIYEVEARHKDGRLVPLEARARLIRDQKGNPTGILIIHRDITERRHTERHLQEESDVSAALVRVGQELISSIDTPVIFDRLCRLTAKVLDAAYSFTALWQPEEEVYRIVAGYGETPEQTEARRAFKVPPERFSRLFALLEKEGVVELATDKVRDAIEQSILRRFRIAAVLYIPLRHGGKIIGLQSLWYRADKRPQARHRRIAQGIAQFASLALANARLFEEAERANRLKEEFISSVSHELRTPLNIILGYTDLLKEETFGPLNAEQTHILGRVTNSARELLDLINTTLDLSRLQSRRAPAIAQAINTIVFFSELAADIEQLPRSAAVRIVWPPAAFLPLLYTDPVKLRMILKNLLTNALKFTEEGVITVAAHQQGDGIVFLVQDTGIGVAPQALPFIFEPFRQAEPVLASNKKGVGLGLYIVRQLVNLLGGKISVSSELGKGTTFQVWIPFEHGCERQ